MNTRLATPDEEQWIDAVRFSERHRAQSQKLCDGAHRELKNHLSRTTFLEQEAAKAAVELRRSRESLTKTKERLLSEIKKEALRENTN